MLPPPEVDLRLLPFPVQMKCQHVQFRREADGDLAETEIKKPEVKTHCPEVQVFTAL